MAQGTKNEEKREKKNDPMLKSFGRVPLIKYGNTITGSYSQISHEKILKNLEILNPLCEKFG